MNLADAVLKLKNSTSILDVFGSSTNMHDISNYKAIYKELALILHPDRNPGFSDEMSKLNKFKSEIEDGVSFKDEASTITYFPDRVEIVFQNAKIANIWYQNLKLLQTPSLVGIASFSRYMPGTDAVLSDNKITYSLYKRAIPLSMLKIPIDLKHCRWIVSRLFEYAAFLDSNGIVHVGINPDSVLVIPENHGVIINSFYHVNFKGAKLKTVSGKWQHFYPSSLFVDKIANNNIDIELIKRTAIYMLGDSSGVGTKLIKVLPEEMLTFFKTSHLNEDSFNVMDKYRAIVKKHFDSKFHELNV